MSWFSKLFGRDAPAKGKLDAATQSETGVTVRVFPRPEKPKAKSEPKGISAARAAIPSLGIDGWVGWNFCAQEDVHGVQHYRDAATKAFNTLKQGDTVELIRNPDNPYDQKAIEVRVKGIMIGYLDKNLSASAAENISHDTPIQAEYSSGHLSKTGYLRITIQPLVPNVASRKRNGWKVASR